MTLVNVSRIVADGYHHIDNGGIRTAVEASIDGDKFYGYAVTFELGQHGRVANMTFDLDSVAAVDSIINTLEKTKKHMLASGNR